jgi:hypothetical protein
VEPEVGPQPPPATRSVWADLTLPDWARTDWALVGLGVARLLLVLFAASALVGLVAAVAVAGNFAAAPCGAAVGSHLAFAAFGARTAAGCGGEHGAVLALGFLPLPWAVIAGVATEAALRFGWRRLPEDRARRIAYAGKLALTCGVALGVIAGLVARGDPNRLSSGFASALNGGEVWFYSSVLIWFWAWVGLRRRGLVVFSSPGPLDKAPVRNIRASASEGAVVFATLAAGLAVAGLVFALAVADGGSERIGLLFGFPVAALSFGAVLVDAGMGAALGGVSGHTSLFHYGLPAGPDAGAAPGWLFVALVLAPAAVAAAVWRRLERDRPADEQGALAVGAATAVGFAATAWLAALIGRIVLLAAVTVPRDGLGSALQFTPLPAQAGRVSVGTLVALRPNPAAVLGLGLLWGLAGGLGAAFLWASRHNARWQISGAAPAAGPAPPPPPPPGPEQSAWLLPESQEADAGEDPPPPEENP